MFKIRLTDNQQAKLILYSIGIIFVLIVVGLDLLGIIYLKN